MNTAAAVETASAPKVIHQNRMPDMDESVSEMGLTRLLENELGQTAQAETPKATRESGGAEAEGKPADEAAANEAKEVDDSVLSQQAAEEKEDGATEDSAPEAGEPEAGAAEDSAPVDDEAEEAGGPSIDDVPRLSKVQRQHVSKIVADRVGKLTPKLAEARSRAEQAEAKAAELEAKLQENQSSPSQVPIRYADNPLSDITDPAKLDELSAKAQGDVDLCEAYTLKLLRNPEAVAEEFKAAGIKLPDDDYSERNMRVYLEEKKLEQKKVLERHVPQQRRQLADQHQFKQRQQQANAEAERRLPWLKDAKHPKNQALAKVLKDNPAWNHLFDGRLIVALAVEQLHQQEAAKGTAAPKVAPVKTPAAKPALLKGAGKPAGPSGAKTSTLLAAEKAYAESSSERNLERLLDAQEEDRQRTR